MSEDKVLAKDGLFDPWFMSDLICIFDGEVGTSQGNCVVVYSSDYKKEIMVFLDEGDEKIVYTIDDDPKSHLTTREHLAVRGFAKKYGLEVEELFQETNEGEAS
jgi:hypothetical protein